MKLQKIMEGGELMQATAYLVSLGNRILDLTPLRACCNDENPFIVRIDTAAQTLASMLGCSYQEARDFYRHLKNH